MGPRQCQGLGFRGSGFTVWGLEIQGFRGIGFEVSGLGLRVENLASHEEQLILVFSACSCRVPPAGGAQVSKNWVLGDVGASNYNPKFGTVHGHHFTTLLEPLVSGDNLSCAAWQLK